jgi:thymidylate synthase ThyX
MHWKTHIWRGRTNTQRNDRQAEYDRNKAPQDSPVDFIGDPNVQHLIDTLRKRLCTMASPETKELAEDLKRALREVEPEIADVLVPNCVYRCGCPESCGCKFFEKVITKFPDMASTDIQKRYDTYNKFFHGE